MTTIAFCNAAREVIAGAALKVDNVLAPTNIVIQATVKTPVLFSKSFVVELPKRRDEDPEEGTVHLQRVNNIVDSITVHSLAESADAVEVRSINPHVGVWNGQDET